MPQITIFYLINYSRAETIRGNTVFYSSLPESGDQGANGPPDPLVSAGPAKLPIQTISCLPFGKSVWNSQLFCILHRQHVSLFCILTSKLIFCPFFPIKYLGVLSHKYHAKLVTEYLNCTKITNLPGVYFGSQVKCCQKHIEITKLFTKLIDHLYLRKLAILQACFI